jgi:hypothetical protein
MNDPPIDPLNDALSDPPIDPPAMPPQPLEEAEPPAPAPAGRSSMPARLAAAAVVAVVAFLILRDYYAGRLTARTATGIVAEAPAELRWWPHPHAASYLVDLQSPGGMLLWEGRVVRPEARLPVDVRAQLQPGVTYFWMVLAMDDHGRRIGARQERFVVRPPPGSGRAP